MRVAVYAQFAVFRAGQWRLVAAGGRALVAGDLAEAGRRVKAPRYPLTKELYVQRTAFRHRAQ
jgi:hypothetical protein